ncbi:beta-lactamase family protein, partial [candidate division KSB1 bacterium]|nr:beta-lactamase family protein [candidate division KSB1 bacterium]
MTKNAGLKKLAVIAFSIVFIACNNPKDALKQVSKQIDHTILAEIDRDNIPGAVVLISKDNTIVYHEAYGAAQKYTYGKKHLSPPVAMQKNTLFDLASLTKVFATTYAVMLLVDQDLIDLDGPVSKYLPEFSAPDKTDITIR